MTIACAVTVSGNAVPPILVYHRSLMSPQRRKFSSVGTIFPYVKKWRNSEE